jgi:hypothetical protein
MFAGTPTVSNLFDVIPRDNTDDISEVVATIDGLMEFIKNYGLQNLQKGRSNFFVLKTDNGHMIVSVTRTEDDNFEVRKENENAFLKQFSVPFFSAFKPRKTRET